MFLPKMKKGKVSILCTKTHANIVCILKFVTFSVFQEFINSIANALIFSNPMVWASPCDPTSGPVVSSSWDVDPTWKTLCHSKAMESEFPDFRTEKIP